jgi:hypothetical protein
MVAHVAQMHMWVMAQGRMAVVLLKVAGCTIYGNQNFSIQLRRSHTVT